MGQRQLHLGPLLAGSALLVVCMRFFEMFPTDAKFGGGLKLIKQMETNDHLLFDMRADPMEPERVIDSAPNAVELIEKMDSLLQANASVYDGIEAKETTLDEETTEQLKALGYIR